MDASLSARFFTGNKMESAAPQYLIPQFNSKPGRGVLQFLRTETGTVLQRQFAQNPLKFLHPRNHGCGAWVYSSTYGGGLVGGDTLDVQIKVDAHATAFYSTQSSTKVYRSELATSQALHATVDSGGLLIIAPDPLVCFADSQFSQTQHFSLAGDANLVFVDWLSAGRVAMGERWAFRHYENKTTIEQHGDEILHDVLRLNPEQGPIASRLRRFNSFASIVLCGPRLAQFGADIQAALAAAPLKRNADLLCTASPLRNSGTLLRILGSSVEEVGRNIHATLSFVPTLLGDNPWSRKW